VVNGAAERLPREYVDYVLSIGQRSSTSRLAALSTAWGQTRAGIVEIGKFRALARPVAVFGSTAEDFALAVALDRMFGATVRSRPPPALTAVAGWSSCFRSRCTPRALRCFAARYGHGEGPARLE
jgi:hypothetical protein